MGNPAAIETDLARLIQVNLSLDDHALTALWEQAIRDYNPCISCSANFLDQGGPRTNVVTRSAFPVPAPPMPAVAGHRWPARRSC